MREFIEALFLLNANVEFVELRVIGTGGLVYFNDFIPSSNREGIEGMALDTANRGDVYFGVLPRVRASGKAEDTTDTTSVLWADFDPKEMAKDRVFRELSKITPPPQIIVDSGSGYHAYWLLKYATPWSEAEAVMRGIAAEYSGDRVYDRARVLRLPGTLNHKTDPPKQVRLLRLDLLAPRLPLSAFIDYADPEPSYEAASSSFADTYGTWGLRPSPAGSIFSRLPSQVALRGDMPWWLIDLLDTDPGKGKRSEHVFHVVACLVELGFDDDTIEEIVQDHPLGVGAKYVEKGASGHRYLSYPLAEARRRVNG